MIRACSRAIALLSILSSLAQTPLAAHGASPSRTTHLTPSQPTAAALELAQATQDAGELPGALDNIKNVLTQALFMEGQKTHGTPCAAGVPACDQAAQHIVEDFAPRFYAQHEQLENEPKALVFDTLMDPEEIVSAAAFMQTPAGKSFLKALLAYSDPGSLPPDLFDRLTAARRPSSARGGASPPDVLLDEAVARFYAATAGLPRQSDTDVRSVVPTDRKAAKP